MGESHLLGGARCGKGITKGPNYCHKGKKPIDQELAVSKGLLSINFEAEGKEGEIIVNTIGGSRGASDFYHFSRTFHVAELKRNLT